MKITEVHLMSQKVNKLEELNFNEDNLDILQEIQKSSDKIKEL